VSQAGERIDDIHARYRSRFSGFPRITRDPDELEEILSDVIQVEQESSAVLTGDEKSRLAEYRALYEKELAGIREARSQGPAALQSHRLQTWANFVQARYARSFAGQDRRTRDLSMLGEMIEDGDRILKDMEKLAKTASTADLQKAIEVTRNNLGVYRTERDRIRAERKKVFGADRGTLFANVANNLFGRYRVHYANKSRVSRSVALLQHIIDALKDVLDGMEALLDDGFDTEAHKKNIALVKQNLSTYRDELKKIKDTRKQTALTQRVGELGGAANEIFAVYRENFAGKNRSTRDLALLAEQIELLSQVGKQMDEIDRAEDDEVNAKNLALVMDMLYLYHREYTSVQQQQQPPKKA
jgi:hypothetical protein